MRRLNRAGCNNFSKLKNLQTTLGNIFIWRNDARTTIQIFRSNCSRHFYCTFITHLCSVISSIHEHAASVWLPLVTHRNHSSPTERIPFNSSSSPSNWGEREMRWAGWLAAAAVKINLLTFPQVPSLNLVRFFQTNLQPNFLSPGDLMDYVDASNFDGKILYRFLFLTSGTMLCCWAT